MPRFVDSTHNTSIFASHRETFRALTRRQNRCATCRRYDRSTKFAAANPSDGRLSYAPSTRVYNTPDSSSHPECVYRDRPPLSSACCCSRLALPAAPKRREGGSRRFDAKKHPITATNRPFATARPLFRLIGKIRGEPFLD